MTSDLGLRVVCVDGVVRAVDRDVAIEMANGRLSGRSMADGAVLWDDAAGGGFVFDLVDGLVHVLAWIERGLAVRVLDARSGEALRTVRFDGLEGAESFDGLRLFDGAYYVSVEAIAQRRTLDGVFVAQAELRGGVQSWAWLSSMLCVADESGTVTALAGDTLERVWSRDEGFDASIRAAGDALLVSNAAPRGDAPVLLALDARSGSERWSHAAFDTALASDGELVLARGRRGWLAALDAATGEVRWRIRTGGEVFAGARTSRGFAALSREGVAVIDRDGNDRGGWDLYAPTSLVASDSVLLCGAEGVKGPREPNATKPGAERSLDASPEIQSVDALPGRALLAPAYTRLDEVRAVLTEIEDLDEAWEALATRGFIPSTWVNDPRRCFYEGSVRARPWSRGAMLAFASDVEGVARVESLWREMQRRLDRWGAGGDDVCWWASARQVGLLSEAEILPLRSRPAREMVADALSPEVFARIDGAVARMRFDGLGYDLVRPVLIAEAEWSAAALVGLGDHDDNPFAPLRAILATGYAFEAGGALLARCFDASLDALEEVDEIPF